MPLTVILAFWINFRRQALFPPTLDLISKAHIFAIEGLAYRIGTTIALHYSMSKVRHIVQIVAPQRDRETKLAISWALMILPAPRHCQIV